MEKLKICCFPENFGFRVRKYASYFLRMYAPVTAKYLVPLHICRLSLSINPSTRGETREGETEVLLYYQIPE